MWVKFEETVMGVRNGHGERTYLQGEVVDLPESELEQLRGAWFSFVSEPTPHEMLAAEKRARAAFMCG